MLATQADATEYSPSVLRQHTPAYVSIRQHTYAGNTGRRDRVLAKCPTITSASDSSARSSRVKRNSSCPDNSPPSSLSCVCLRQHTSAYVSIRQHTSAYVRRNETARVPIIRPPVACRVCCVCLRQHTSAYVSIRQQKRNSSCPDYSPPSSLCCVCVVN
jgi:hypothetical protein